MIDQETFVKIWSPYYKQGYRRAVHPVWWEEGERDERKTTLGRGGKGLDGSLCSNFGRLPKKDD